MVVAASTCRTETVFDYSWKHVVCAYWNRYPNPSSTHVLTEDTIKREVRDGKLYSRRLLSKTNPVPKWGARFYNNVPVKIVEDSVLDPVKKTFTTFTRNLGMKKIMKVDEIVIYSEQNDGRTLAVRRAYISSQVFGFSRAIRAFGIERFKVNGNKASNGFNYVLRRMFPQHQLAAATTATTGASASSQQGTTAVAQYGDMAVAASASANHSGSNSSKTDALKRTAKIGYEFCKSHASKIAQLFSVRN
ncbi:hypothetical protein ACLKA6_008827 [Drosophila palustris]